MSKSCWYFCPVDPLNLMPMLCNLHPYDGLCSGITSLFVLVKSVLFCVYSAILLLFWGLIEAFDMFLEAHCVLQWCNHVMCESWSNTMHTTGFCHTCAWICYPTSAECIPLLGSPVVPFCELWVHFCFFAANTYPILSCLCSDLVLIKVWKRHWNDCW